MMFKQRYLYFFGLALTVKIALCAQPLNLETNFSQKEPAKYASKQFHSLVCNNEKLQKQLLKSVSQPLTVTRDSFNVPTIEGGSFSDIYYTLGYEQMRDRLFQFWLNYKALNGQLASVIGASGVSNDIAVRQTSYSDAELLAQYNEFSQLTQIATTQFILGINQRIQDVLTSQPNAPMPAEFIALGLNPTPITLPEYLRFALNLLIMFSSQTSEESGTLTMFSQMGNLVVAGKTVDQAKAICADFYGMKKKRSIGIAANCTETMELDCFGKKHKNHSCNKLDKPSLDAAPAYSSSLADSVPNSTDCTVEEYLKIQEEIKQLRNELGIFCLSSHATTFSGDVTLSGKPMLETSPQVNLTTIPGFFWFCNIINTELGIDQRTGITPGSPFPQIGVFGLNNYHYTSSVQVGTLPGRPALMEDPSEDIFLRTESIIVRGGSPVLVNIYASPYLGFVAQRNIISPLYTGLKSIVIRNLDYGRDLKCFDAVFLLTFASSKAELFDTWRGPGWSTGIGYFRCGFDNQSTSFAGELSGWYDFDSENNCIPQGVLGNPIPPSSSIPKRSGYILTNFKKGYAATWNTAIVQKLPSVYGDAEQNRSEWLEQYIDALLSKRKIQYSDLQNYLINTGNSCNGVASPPNTAQNYNTDAFYLFKKRFAEAVAAYPTADRVAAVALLSDFAGHYVEGDEYAVINSLNASDKWLLAQSWVWHVQKNIIQPTFGAAYPGFTVSSTPNSTTGFGYSRWVQAFLARLLGVAKVSNPIFYQDWLTPIGNLNLLIAQSLDQALADLGGLGARPWGTNKRAVSTYTNAVLGPVSFPGSVVPSANRSAAYMTAQLSPKCSIDLSYVGQIGQSGLILFQGSTPVLQDSAMQVPYLRFEPLIQDSVDTKSCACKK